MVSTPKRDMFVTTVVEFPCMYDDYISFGVRILNQDEVCIGTGHGIFIKNYDETKHAAGWYVVDGISGDAVLLYENFNVKYLSGDCLRLVLFDGITILPEYRGNGYGIDAMKGIIDFFSNMFGTVILIYPHPIGKPLKKDGKARLQKYWAKCGFRHYKNGCFLRECDLL
jgi:hypothetical protein